MKEVFVERYDNLVRIAIKNQGKLEECFIEEEGTEIYPGQIYKGVIKNVVPAIKCAFVDIGEDKSGYLYIDSKFNNLKTKKGDEVLVEIVKESIGSKGPKVNDAITIPGRYAVITTLNNEMEISKKINDSEYIDKLKKEIIKPSDVGIMIRTNALKVSIESVNSEINYLYEIYNRVMIKGKTSNKNEIIYDAGGAIGKVLRDFVDETVSKIIVNSKKDFEYINGYIKNKEDIALTVEMYNGSINLMDYYGIEKEILNLINNRVTLDCGGFIVIDKTEAMYVIDVNSGKNVKGKDIKSTAVMTNIEAAREIIRQIRLRNLSGIIVIDFIDINDSSCKKKILEILHHGFENDKNKTVVYPFTDLNLIQIARRRRGKSISEYIEEKCSTCDGNGRQLKFSYIKNLIKNKITRITSEHSGKKNIYLEIGKKYKNSILNDKLEFVKELNIEDGRLYVNFKEKMTLYKVELVLFEDKLKHLEQFKVYG
ncbi:Rne/Rng family ribonuclease [Clostridium hydrogenum]|uniref:Rne/Rng family ribonuclease n=1 Tax=Clostridium hydrogenum TaxID=2855764 RepID=UPI002E374CC6|nr:Rne/Rng family ribonuclease [Clostridium hydrogenum]